MFTSSLEREIRHSHVEVAQREGKKCTKKRAFLLIKPFFLRSRCRSRRWVLKSIISRGNQRLVASRKEKNIKRRLRLYKGASLSMSPRAPQPNPNLLLPQKHINSDWVRVWGNQPPVASQNVCCLIRLIRRLNTEKAYIPVVVFIAVADSDL